MQCPQCKANGFGDVALMDGKAEAYVCQSCGYVGAYRVTSYAYTWAPNYPKNPFTEAAARKARENPNITVDEVAKISEEMWDKIRLAQGNESDYGFFTHTPLDVDYERNLKESFEKIKALLRRTE